MLTDGKVLDWIVTALCAMVGIIYWANERKHEKADERVAKLEERVKDDEAHFAAHRENVAEKYVSRAEVKEFLAEVKAMLRDISDKLDRKADRP